MAKSTAKAAPPARGRGKGAAAAPKKAAKPKDSEDWSLDDLSALAAENAQLGAAHKDADGKQFSYLRIIGNSAAADRPFKTKGGPDYIQGADDGCFIIPTKKINLGKAPHVTVLAMFKFYEDSIEGEIDEKQKKKGDKAQRKVTGYRMPAEAEVIEVEGAFDRPYIDKNGVEHILRPVHWVFLRLHSHTEIEDALLTFRSKGNAIYKELQKLINVHAKACTELNFKMSTQAIKAEAWNTEYLYPAFELDGRNYDTDDDGKISLCKGGFDMATLASVLKLANKLEKDYAGCHMVSSQSIASIAGKAQAQITDKTAQYVEDDDEDDGDKPAKF